MNLKYTIDNEASGKTVKHILKVKLALSERLIKKLKFSDKILKNSIPVHINEIVSFGDSVEVLIDFIEENDNIIPEKIDINIIYEDDCILALNKQPGIVVHPTSSHNSGTIANGIMYYFKQNDIFKKIRPVSRLDRDTSGIIIFAKNQFVQEALIRQMSGKSFYKEYIGVADGVVTPDMGTIDLPIERKPGSIMLRHVSDTGAPSVTHYKVIEHLSQATCMSFVLETGRTHQIRVHCQAIGHPLLGDTLYSDNTSDYISRQALHSAKVCFCHPISRQKVVLEAPIPEDIKRLVEILRK